MPTTAESSRPQDVATIDAIISAMYAVISGPAGQKRDWDRFRSLFLPEARLVLAISRENEAPRVRILDVEGYIRRTAPIFEREGFWERETERKTETFGNIAHLLSSYESRHEENGEPFTRGLNSIQLFYDRVRWWIVTVMWNTERS